MHTRAHILPLLHDALRAVGAPTGCPILLDVPRRSESRGDLSTGIALALAGTMGGSPRRIAEAIVAAIPADDPAIASVEIAGPGFINITFTPEFHALHLRHALALGERYGRVERGSPRRVVVEHHAAPGSGDDDAAAIRGGLLAYALATLLRWRGDEVRLRLDARSSTTATGSILDTLGACDEWDAMDAGWRAAPRVLVIAPQHDVAGSAWEDDGIMVVRHGGLSLKDIIWNDDGARHEGSAALRGLIGEMGPTPSRLLLLGESPGAAIRLDAGMMARHSATSPPCAAPYTLFAIDALLRAATTIAPFDPHALPVSLATPAALRLARHLLLFPDTLARSADALDPSLLVDHLTETAALAWPLVTGHPLVTARGTLDTARLPLLAAAAMVIRNGLAALGGR